MSDKFIQHRVERGDTIESIAKKYGISPFVLSRINNGLRNSQLREGSYVVIGSRSAADDKSSGQTQEPDASKDKQNYIEPQEITEEELLEMAKNAVGSNLDKLAALDMGKNSALNTIQNKKKKAEYSFQDTVEALNKELKSGKEDFAQNAIKQGISQSSIVDSVGKELESQTQQELERSQRDNNLTIDELSGAAKEVLMQYRADVASAKAKYEKALASAMNNIKTKNDAINDKIAEYNGGAKPDGYDLTDKLLDTLSKKRARDYLARNSSKLRDLWGDSMFDKINKQYR